jgi:hypothetical protein
MAKGDRKSRLKVIANRDAAKFGAVVTAKLVRTIPRRSDIHRARAAYRSRARVNCARIELVRLRPCGASTDSTAPNTLHEQSSRPSQTSNASRLSGV